MRRHALAALAYLTLASPTFAQTAPTPPVGPDFAKINVVTVDLGHKTWMLEGAGGNVRFAADGATVVVLVIERAMLAAGTTSIVTGVKFPPVDGGGLPAKTY